MVFEGNILTNRPKLKGKALRVFQSAEFDITNKRIDIPLLKPEIHYKNVSLLVC